MTVFHISADIQNVLMNYIQSLVLISGGMTGAMSGAMIISDMITGIENAYAGIFDPSRSIMKPQLFINLAETTVNFSNRL